MARRLLSLLAATALLSQTTLAADGLAAVEDSLQAIVSRSADPVAGIWQIGGTAGTRFAVIDGSKGFDILILDSPDLSVEPATLCGTLTPTGRKGVYDASFVDPLDSRVRSNRFIVELGENSTMIFKPYKQSTTVSFMRMIPYFLRFSIRRENTRPGDVDAAHRLYPRTVTLPVTL